MDGSRVTTVIQTPVGPLAFVDASPVPGGIPEKVVHDVVNQVKALVAAIASVTSNAELSVYGQVAALDSTRRETTIGAGTGWQQFAAYIDMLNKRKAELLAVPEPSPADVLVDQEIRGRLDSVDATRRNSALALAERGEAPRLALALIRSPFLGEVLDTVPDGVAERAWEASRRAADPGTFKALDDELESVEWARPILLQAAQVIEKLSAIPMAGAGGKSTKHMLYDAGLRDTAYQAWGITPADWAAFMRQQSGRAA